MKGNFPGEIRRRFGIADTRGQVLAETQQDRGLLLPLSGLH